MKEDVTAVGRKFIAADPVVANRFQRNASAIFMKAPGNPEVLIVEAREDYRAKLHAMLTRIGCVGIEAVADNQEALKLLESHAEGFGLVVCDLDIGGMDGLEFIRHASRLGVGGLVLYSKHDDAVRSSAEWMARAYKAPLLGVLGVPFTLTALEKLVGRLHIQRTVYSDVVAQHGPDNADRAAVEELEFALEAMQFVPHYQPKLCLATGALRGAEVLARWEHPQLGLLAPVHFVALMEEVDLIEPLTHQILDQAGRHAVDWAKRGLDTHLAINVSPLTLEREHCARDLLNTIARAGALPSQFTFEITEKAFAQDATTVLENVLRLRMKGCGISVDDFGTGYSSLQQLNRSPITELKLDRSFVRRIATNSKAASIIESTLVLAAKLKLKTVGEGIDSEEQRRWLAQLGCQIGQGYLFAKPMDRDSFFEWCIEKQRLAA